MRDGDVVVLFLLLILLLILLGRTWKKTDPDSVILHSTLPIQGKVPNLLEEKGYEVIAEKQRLPLWVQIDEKQFESRLYADYIARRGEGGLCGHPGKTEEDVATVRCSCSGSFSGAYACVSGEWDIICGPCTRNNSNHNV